ncbi:MAG: FkbM family methyltransferase [Patescibacteria group bacterium]
MNIKRIASSVRRGEYSFVPPPLDFFIPIAGLVNWPDYFLNLLKRKRVLMTLYRLRNGQRIQTRSNTMDRCIVLEVALRRDYNNFPGFEINPGDVVVDIGAHLGAFSLTAAGQARVVYAFEPVESNYRLLKENLALNHIKNVQAFQLAVSDVAGAVELFFNPRNNGGHSLVLPMNRIRMSVESITLEGVFQRCGIETIDFLKMDIEGAEYDILCKSPPELLERISRLALEFHVIDEGRNENVLRQFLESHGFEVRVKRLVFTHHGLLWAKRI